MTRITRIKSASSAQSVVKRFFRLPESKLHGHEDAVGIFPISSKGAAPRETKTSIQLPRRLKIIHRAGLQAQPAIPAALCFGDDVFHHPRGDSLSLEGVRRSHGFNLTMVRIQFLQRSTSGEFGSIPNGPKGDLRLSQSVQVQRVTAFRRGNPLHAAEMLLQQFDYLGPTKVIDSNVHKSFPPAPAGRRCG
jgi:hypothetical protein